MNEPAQTPKKPDLPQAKSPWERPNLRLLGDVAHLVQGGGKSGPNADSDPQSTRKTGVG